MQDLEEWHNDIDVSDNNNSYLFEFVEVISFVVILWGNSNELVYFIKIKEKDIAEYKLRDQLRWLMWLIWDWFSETNFFVIW